jgi:hypothetical protein
LEIGVWSQERGRRELKRRKKILIGGGVLSLVAAAALVVVYQDPNLRSDLHDALRDAYYDYDPRKYTYRVECPVLHSFESRCNPEALDDEAYAVDGPIRRVPRECLERVAHDLLRTIPHSAFDAIGESEHEIFACSERLKDATSIRIRGVEHRGQPLLIVSLTGKHGGVPRDYSAFEWSEPPIVEHFDGIEHEFHRLTVARQDLDALECVYHPFEMRMDRLSYLDGSFVCAENFDAVQQFISSPPTYQTGPPAQ